MPVRPTIAGLETLGARDGVHALHARGDTFALTDYLDRRHPKTALIVGAGYVGLEMAEALTRRGIAVIQVEALPEVLPTLDPELGALVRNELERHGVEVHTRTTVTGIHRHETETEARAGSLRVEAAGPQREPLHWDVGLVLVVVGVRPDTELLTAAGAETGPAGQSSSTAPWPPGSRTCGRPTTASSPTTACWA